MSIKKISGYTIYLNQVLGKGSFGCVYKGKQDTTEVICAIKMLSKKNIDSDEYLKNTLFSEIAVLKSVKSKNIVGFFDVMESSQNYYIIQQLCDSDLEKLLKKKGGKIPQQQAIHILKQMCSGFLALVREGIVHRDLKPANVLLANGVVKIGDFGFAKKNPNQRIRNQTAVGTPLYMCVEILKGQPYSSKCDIWALGFIFYQILHGYTPWSANTQFELVRNIEGKPLKIDQNLSNETKSFLERSLEVKQANRMGWDEVFLHKIFNNAFAEEKGNFENKLKKVMKDLKFNTIEKNLDLKKLFERFGYSQQHQLKFKQFQQIIRSINPHISSDQQVYVFQTLDSNDSNSISLKELLNVMENHNINIDSKHKGPISMPNNNYRAQSLNHNEQNFQNQKKKINQQLNHKIKDCFFKLNKILTLKKLTLYNTFCIYDADKSGNLKLDEFNKIIKRLDNTMTQEQLQILFDYVDTDKSKTISFDQLNRYYCYINGIPQSLQVPPQYYFIKNQQNTPYYQQMKEANGSEYALNKLKEAFLSSVLPK